MALLTIEDEDTLNAEDAGGDDSLILGIDFGTTNSVCYRALGGKGLELLKTESCKHGLIPTVISFLSNGNVLYGLEAKSAEFKSDTIKIESVKRLIGLTVDELERHYGLKVRLNKELNMPEMEIVGKHYTVVQLVAMFLTYLIKEAVKAFGLPKAAKIKCALTVPAHFDDTQRNIVKTAAALAGLDVMRVINEPTAAALAYGLESGVEGVYVVYDLGGGTFDVSVLKMQMGVFKVLATSGDTRLGGDDFDLVVLKDLTEHFNIDAESLTFAESSFLKDLCKQAKEGLTNANAVEIKAEEVAKASIKMGNRQQSYSLTKGRFEEIAESLMKKTLKCVRKAIKDSKVDVSKIESIILVGGATRMPLVKGAILTEFPDITIKDQVDPDKIVAIGAAHQASGLHYGSENLLLDVVPLSLGLETVGGIVEKIVHRNTTIPVSVAQEFTTFEDFQTAMQINVVQGERELAKDCRQLARFEITQIPPMRAGLAKVRVVFTVDADGVTTVEATEEKTQSKASVQINPTYGIDFGEMRKMLEDSMINARQDIEERLLQECIVEAKKVSLSAKNMLECHKNLLSQQDLAFLQKETNALEEMSKICQDRDLLTLATKKLEEEMQPFLENVMNNAVAKNLKGKRIDGVLDA